MSPQPEHSAWDLASQVEIFASELADLYAKEKANSRELERRIRELRDAQVQFARAFALVVEGRDPETRAHLDRTTKWATRVSEAMGLPDIEQLQLGFLLHDIGKWAVPQEIIQKPGPLDDREQRMMRVHPVAGVQMIHDVALLRPARAAIRHHHERWDGEGYPDGLAGTDIPLPARIFAVADVFDALTSERPYRKRSFTVDEAIEIITADRGTHFDPEVVDVFVDVVAPLERGTRG